MNEIFALVALLTIGRHHDHVVPMSDYETAEQCETARVVATDHWNNTHPIGYRVKFTAECLLVVDGDE